MSIRAKFDIDYDTMPMVFETAFGADDVFIGLNYNELGDFYTADLYDGSYQPIILGEKLVYGKRLWRQSSDPRVPIVDLMPLDESGKESTVSASNFGKTVFLYLDSELTEETAIES